MKYCPLCGAYLNGATFCRECGCNPRETAEAVLDGFTWATPADDPWAGWPIDRNAQEYAPSPRCRCSHIADSHSHGTGRCWSVVCGCRSFRPEEVAS